MSQTALGNTMQRSITLATRGREPTVAYWTLALIGIVSSHSHLLL